MADSLVIVESPAKAKTINKYLGKNFEVKSSLGHIKDLPKNKLGIDLEKDFTPQYTVIKGKNKIVDDLKKSASGKKSVYLAPDPDREGEAIAWHIAGELASKKVKIYRVTFNEITKSAIQDAFKSPGQIDTNKVNAQQARRILDRLVGYQISPLLWGKLATGLSAGRVQSVALKMICDREDEILNFKQEEYWSIIAELQTADKTGFHAKLVKENDKNIKIANKDCADEILSYLKTCRYIVSEIKKQDKKKRPSAPFITSTLQQEASRHFSFTASKTMMIAQTLYEGIELGKEGSTGLITYMRTDSTRIADSAVKDARDFIESEFSKKYLPPKPQIYTTKKSAQDAHEAIRPTFAHITPDSIKQYLSSDQFKLYSLIWKRFVASQMESAVISQTSVDITAGKYLFRVTGSIIKFDGFMKLYMEKEDKEKTAGDSDEGEEPNLPDLKKNDVLNLIKLDPKQHFTQPPPRYTEATLIKELELNGIGRPSTYAAIMERIQDKDYTKKIKGKFHPTELGKILTLTLKESFSKIMNEKFTASMETDLDEIEKGTKNWLDIIKQFYSEFSTDLENAQKNMKSKSLTTDIRCDLCGKIMVVKWGKKGGFLACSGYPDCKKTLNYEKTEDGRIVPAKEIQPQFTEDKCANCGKPMILRKGRFGEFLACSGYPECKTTKPVKSKETFKEQTDILCPQEGCGGNLVKRKGRKGRIFYGCSRYPKCKFIANSLENMGDVSKK